MSSVQSASLRADCSSSLAAAAAAARGGEPRPSAATSSERRGSSAELLRRGSEAGLKGCTRRHAAAVFGRLARHRNGIMRVSSAAGAGAVSVARRRLQHRRAGRRGAAAVTASPF